MKIGRQGRSKPLTFALHGVTDVTARLGLSSQEASPRPIAWRHAGCLARPRALQSTAPHMRLMHDYGVSRRSA